MSFLTPGSAERDAAFTSAAIAEQNAAIAEQEAVRKGEVGIIEKRKILQRREDLLGEARVKTGASGFTSAGGPLAEQIDIAEVLTLDALTHQFNVRVSQEQSRQEARISRAQAKSFRRTGRRAVGRALTSLAIQVAVSRQGSQ